MAVQPLKSLAISASALGASSLDIRISGTLLGLTLFVLSFCKLKKIESFIPQVLIHGIQLSLGLLLITQGYQQSLGLAPLMLFLALGIIVFLILADQIWNLPLLGFSVMASYWL
jgi:MFS superfamily sulfate permease-like transporter